MIVCLGLIPNLKKAFISNFGLINLSCVFRRVICHHIYEFVSIKFSLIVMIIQGSNGNLN